MLAVQAREAAGTKGERGLPIAAHDFVTAKSVQAMQSAHIPLSDVVLIPSAEAEHPK